MRSIETKTEQQQQQQQNKYKLNLKLKLATFKETNYCCYKIIERVIFFLFFKILYSLNIYQVQYLSIGKLNFHFS